MKKITLALCSATVLLFSCNNSADDASAKKDTAVVAEVKKETSPMAMPDSATMMKNWQMYMTPGDMQKMIASWDGTWNSEITMWEKPDAPPTKSTGTTVNKMIMGGRYQQSVSNSTMMGMPFEGHGTLGYDNAKKMMVSTWIDNMGTGIMYMTGTWDSTTKSCNFTGRTLDPMTLSDKDYKETFKVVDDNTQVMEMYGPGPDGKEAKMMEIKFTRKK